MAPSESRTRASSPAAARRGLRRELRRARDATGLTQGQVADALDWSLSKVNRIEMGEVTVSTTDLRALLALYGVVDPETIAGLEVDARTSRRRGWWDEARYREHLTWGMRQYLQFESEATTVRQFQPILIPGLLQTPAYAEALLTFRWSEHLSPEAVQARLEARLRRPELSLDRESPPECVLILDESAVRRNVVGPVDMRAQLSLLLARMASPNVVLRLLPYGVASSMAQIGAFTILDLGSEEDAVLYRETWSDDEIIEAPEAIRQHRSHFESLGRHVLSEEKSADLIRGVLRTM